MISSVVSLVTWCVWSTLGLMVSTRFAYSRITSQMQPMWFQLSMIAMTISIAQAFEATIAVPVIYFRDYFVQYMDHEHSEILAHFVVALVVVFYVYKLPKFTADLSYRWLAKSL